MQVVFRPDERAHADDEEVAEAGDEGDDPDRHPQDEVGQQVLKRGDPVCVGLALPHVRGVGAILEILEVSERQTANSTERERERESMRDKLCERQEV